MIRLDEGPNAAAAFMANLSSTSGNNHHVNEVHPNAIQINDSVNYQLLMRCTTKEQADLLIESELDDNTTLYHHLNLNAEPKLFPQLSAKSQELSREQVYWLPANEIASQASTPATPVTPYVPKSPPPSQVLATLHNIKAVFPQFDAIIKERTTVKPLYVSLCGSTEGSCDQQALDTDRIQLKDMITSLRIQLDGLKVENVECLKRWYEERSKANTDSQTAYTENLSALTAEHNKAQAQNHVDSNLLVKHSVFVSNSNNDCGACNKSLVFSNHNACLVMCDDSVNDKPHPTKRSTRQPTKEWKPINKVGKPIKRVWNSISKNIANTKPQWKPTGRHFSLYEMHPLTRIMEPSAETLALSPSVSSSAQITMISRFPDCKFCDPQSGSKGISGCSRHMTGDRARLINFVEKFIGTVRFGNDEYAAIVAMDEYKLGDIHLSILITLKDSSTNYSHRIIFVIDVLEIGFEMIYQRYAMPEIYKDHLCPSCQLGKSKKASHLLKAENTNNEVLHTLHMDLCGPIRTESINRKKYVLVIVDDYTKFGWVRFLRTKDETPHVIEKFIVKTQRALNATVRFVCWYFS
ncbi:reverse transcriptase domain-containing protein [Tanacetum coccineum]